MTPQPTFKIIPFDQLLDAPDIEFVRAGGVDRAHAARLALSIRAAYGLYPTTLGLFAHELPLAEPARDKKGCYYLRAGYHRRAALRLLAEGGVVEVDGAPVEFTPDARWAAGVPCVVADHTSNLDAAIGSNTHQKALNPVEAARAAQYLRDNGYSLADAARVLGKSESATSNLQRLLALPAPVLDLIAQGVLTERHGRALLWLAEHLPDVLADAIRQNGQGLWASDSDYAEGITDEIIDGTTNLHRLTVAATERRVKVKIQKHAPPLAIWPLDWDPAEADGGEALRKASIYRVGPCQACPAKVKWNGELRCLDQACNEGRYRIYMSRVRAMQPGAPVAERAAVVDVTLAPEEAQPGAAPPVPARDAAPAEEADHETAVYEAEQRLRRKAVKDRHRAFLDAVAGAPDPAALLAQPVVLRWLDQIINRPAGWSPNPKIAAETQARAILHGVALYIAKMGWINEEDRAAFLDELIATVGQGTIESEPDGDPPAPDAPDDESVDDFLARVGGHTGADGQPVHVRADARQPTLCGLDDPPGRRFITVRYAQMKRRAGDLDGICADCLAALEALPDPPTLAEQEVV